METWSALAGVGAVVAAGVAIWAVIVAHRANGRAAKSNEIADESLKVAREAHELNKKLAPAAWSLAEPMGEDSVRFRNQSGQHLIVTGLLMDPDAAAKDARAEDRPFRVEHGDAFAVGFSYTYASTPAEKITIEWHPEGDDRETRVTERKL